MKLRQGAVFGTAIGALAATLVGAAAFAATPAVPGADGIIRVCVESRDLGHYNDLRFLLNGYKWCKSGEKQIWWNQKGRTGATGPKGATGPAGANGADGAPGPAGPPGVSGYSRLNSGFIQVAPNAANTVASVDCPAGKKAVGGGFAVDGTVIVRSSGPLDDDTWLVTSHDPGGAGGTVLAYVVCATAP